ncbi:MAG TPA: ABC transporter ATP-binding protein [Candidatus Nanoarchaeia archaeon]|nr:ABC transporter ATP-binding protein [Candidatus Nanoarchaeia archaeon]
MKSIIKLEKIWKIYHIGNVRVEALRGVDIDILQKEFVAILGSSGSGKSTLMALIGALDIPTKGAVFLDGKDISRMSESHLAMVRGRKIGFVFQQFNLISTLSAIENVMLPIDLQERPNSKQRAIELLTLVGLKERMHHKPQELSGGQQQRVAIARALANDPEVILADEPTGNLDSKTGKEIIGLFTDLYHQGKTIILVTHDIGLIKYAERVIHLKDGLVEKVTRVKRAEAAKAS